MTGAEALVRSLLEAGAETVFGYPGGAILPVYDKLYDYADRLRHILVRHEQGAVHAAQGFARVSGRTGVVIVTSGPGAANVITGLSDAMADSTPLVVVTGQVGEQYLGSDAFQETDVVGITQPITKWAYQVRRDGPVRWCSTSPRTRRSAHSAGITIRSTSYAATTPLRPSTERRLSKRLR